MLYAERVAQIDHSLIGSLGRFADGAVPAIAAAHTREFGCPHCALERAHGRFDGHALHSPNAFLSVVWVAC